MVVGFATLRGGPNAATTTIGIGVVVALVVVALAGMPVTSIGLLAPMVWLPTAIASEILRRTASLPIAIGSVLVISLITVVSLLALQAPMDGFWTTAVERLKVLTTPPEGVSSESTGMGAFSTTQLVALLQAGAGITVLVFATAGLFLARSGQAKLFNPGGFQREFHALYFGKQVGIICLVLLLMGILAGGALGIALATLALMPLLFQGLAVIHALVKTRSLGVGWLVGVYVMLMFVQPVTLLVGAIGFIDNIRRLPRQ